MKGGVALVGEVGILEVVRVVLGDALHEDEVVEVDGTPQSDGDVDPRWMEGGGNGSQYNAKCIRHIIVWKRVGSLGIHGRGYVSFAGIALS